MWIDIKKELPPLTKWVMVKGVFTPDDIPYPIAQTASYPPDEPLVWKSMEWRGMVGLTHWWKKENDKTT